MGTALITGASAGIGAEFARRLAAAGEDLILVARREDRLDALAAELRAAHAIEIETIAADLADLGGLGSVADRLASGDVTVLVNNAGINGYGPFDRAEPAVLGGVLALNTQAPLLLTRAAIGPMLAAGSGAIINVASLLAFSGALGTDPLPARAAYGATKAFLVAFSRILAAELDGAPVYVQALCPGYTATEFHLSNGTAPVQEPAPADQPRAMSAADVVQASLVAWDRGEILCIPGLEDPAAVDALTEVEARLREGSRPAIAGRYR